MGERNSPIRRQYGLVRAAVRKVIIYAYESIRISGIPKETVGIPLSACRRGSLCTVTRAAMVVPLANS